MEKIVGDYLYSCGQDVQPESAVQYSNMYRYVQESPLKYSNMYRYVQESAAQYSNMYRCVQKSAVKQSPNVYNVHYTYDLYFVGGFPAYNYS